MNQVKVNEAISEMQAAGFCEDGIKAVRKLVTAITGEELTSPLEVEAGDVFCYDGGEKWCILATDCNNNRFLLGGVKGNPTVPFADQPKTKQELITYLSRTEKIVKIGRLTFDGFKPL